MKFTKKPLILIVDDVVGNIQIVGNLLIESGYNISVSIHGRQALNTAKNIHPDLILLDVMMPEIDGFDVCRELKKDEKLKDVPVIFLTAKHETKDIVTGFSVGGVDFITKPFQKQEVLARIENQLELKFSRDLLIYQSEEIKLMNDKLNEELSIAAEYFRFLLPAPFSDKYVHTFWEYMPNAKLGGDAFGYNWIDDKNFVMYLFDVSGHGIASGMYSISLMNTLKYLNLADTDFLNPESVFSALNKLFQIHEHYGLYFTMWYGVFNVDSRELRYAAAGHPPSVISFPNGSTEFLSSPNFIIGGLDKYEFKSKTCIIEPNTDIYIFSDGTFDLNQPDGKNWGIDDMRLFLEARHSRADKELKELQQFVKNLYEFSKQKDDFSILKVRFL
ncbi:MAG: SpoIIE family protein phosphatase [Candidatus Kapabacteria bacterium]|nr:SpoIIE family protein phosphatase [Ignavibacteriota bacterium]MCW5884294.1 SpoIIE family protein phosphatase [Candidatus Kapabacteria bacterium]